MHHAWPYAICALAPAPLLKRIQHTYVPCGGAGGVCVCVRVLAGGWVVCGIHIWHVSATDEWLCRVATLKCVVILSQPNLIPFGVSYFMDRLDRGAWVFSQLWSFVG